MRRGEKITLDHLDEALKRANTAMDLAADEPGEAEGMSEWLDAQGFEPGAVADLARMMMAVLEEGEAFGSGVISGFNIGWTAALMFGPQITEVGELNG